MTRREPRKNFDEIEKKRDSQLEVLSGLAKEGMGHHRGPPFCSSPVELAREIHAPSNLWFWGGAGAMSHCWHISLRGFFLLLAITAGMAAYVVDGEEKLADQTTIF